MFCIHVHVVAVKRDQLQYFPRNKKLMYNSPCTVIFIRPNIMSPYFLCKDLLLMDDKGCTPKGRFIPVVTMRFGVVVSDL